AFFYAEQSAEHHFYDQTFNSFNLLTISNSHVFELFKPFEQLNSLTNLKIHHQHLIPKPANGQDQDENKEITDKPVALPYGQPSAYEAAQRVANRHRQRYSPD